MVFSSVPAYLDPSNWQQQQNHHLIGGSGTNHFLAPSQPAAAAPPPPPPLPCGSGGGGAGQVRPGSMSERARMANIPMPETALKCPRCESTNTKFCYFNNYSLSQPRHFCKTCRRYWTRGGALRSVPVGGGCRRNKRSKSSNSKSSPASSDRGQTTSTSTSTVSTTGGATANMLGLNPPFPPLRFTSPLSQLSDSFDMGLNYNGISGTAEMNFNGGSNLLGSGGGSMASFLSSIGGGSGSGGNSIEPWRLQHLQAQQQFPFFGGLDPSPAGMYQFQGGEPGFMSSEPSQPVRPKLSSSLLTQLASVKMEENPDLNLSRQLLGGINQNQQWNSTANWTDLSSFSSSSTSNPL